MKIGIFIKSTVLLVVFCFIAPSFVHAAGAISFNKFNKIFGSRSKYSIKKKDALIKKLTGKTVVWKGRMQGKFIHYSRISITLDMGADALPRNVIIVLERSEKEKLEKIGRDSIVKVKAKVKRYGKVKYHELEDGTIISWKKPKKKSAADVDPKDLRFPKKKPKKESK
ncbi:MAG: hypothetical protein HQK84_04735 [Nitrospinae bacterium]|nr:hypothetical protein [Nitrospinota bacterium]